MCRPSLFMSMLCNKLSLIWLSPSVGWYRHWAPATLLMISDNRQWMDGLIDGWMLKSKSSFRVSKMRFSITDAAIQINIVWIKIVLLQQEVKSLNKVFAILNYKWQTSAHFIQNIGVTKTASLFFSIVPKHNGIQTLLSYEFLRWYVQNIFKENRKSEQSIDQVVNTQEVLKSPLGNQHESAEP